MRRLFATILILGIATPALAADLAASISSEARAAASQARPNARGQNDDNPYFLPAVIIMGAGGLVALYGMTHDTGVQCTDTRTSFACGTTKSKATIFTGVGMIGVGAYLFYKGRQQSSSPEILAGPNVIGVRQRLSW